MEKIKTVKKEYKIEFEEKKSKFIGYVKPVFSKEEAEEYIKYIKNLHSDATHNCSAYKINKDFYDNLENYPYINLLDI